MAARQSGLPPLGLPPLSRPRTGSPQTALQPTLLLEEMMLVQAEMQVEATAAGGADGSVTIKERCVPAASCAATDGRCGYASSCGLLNFPSSPYLIFKNNSLRRWALARSKHWPARRRRRCPAARALCSASRLRTAPCARRACRQFSVVSRLNRSGGK